MRTLWLALLASTLTLSFASANIRVGLVMDPDGRNDRGFNAAAYSGMEKARDKLKIQFDIRETKGDAAHEAAFRELAQAKYDLILALGIARAGALAKIAKQFPKAQFAIVDAEVSAPNVRSILFEEQEGSFLVGALAALTLPKSAKFGFVGGMDIPVTRRYLAGYRTGLKTVRKDAELLVEWVGKDPSAWGNNGQARVLAAGQYTKGAEVVFAVASGANLGVIDAAGDSGKFAIGSPMNQNWVKPGRVLTSMRKRIDIGVFMTCQDAMTGGFTAGLKRYGLSSQGVDFVLDENNEKLIPAAALEKIQELKDRIIAGSLKVPTQ